MFDIVTNLLDLIDCYAPWLYVACLAIALYYLRQYLLAHRERTSTIFTIEKEVAVHRQGKAISGIGVAFGIAAVITAVKYYVVPNVDLAQLTPPTPTMTFRPPTRQPPTPSATPTPTEPPTSTYTPAPSATPTTESPTSTYTPVPSATPSATPRPTESPMPTYTPTSGS